MSATNQARLNGVQGLTSMYEMFLEEGGRGGELNHTTAREPGALQYNTLNAR